MSASESNLTDLLKKYAEQFHPVVQYNPAKEKIIAFDFTQTNELLKQIDLSDSNSLCSYINDHLKNAHAKFGIGGYNELRTLYSRSSLFDDDINKNFSEVEEPRRLHLGVDIWGKEGTEIFAPFDGIVHSFAFNNNFGDYGVTIILSHQLKAVCFFTLYGHLSYADLRNIHEGDYVERGEQFAHFGTPEENGNWPPHLHFQIIENIENYKGDYPGVCKFSEREKYLANCPDPDLILNVARYTIG